MLISKCESFNCPNPSELLWCTKNKQKHQNNEMSWRKMNYKSFEGATFMCKSLSLVPKQIIIIKWVMAPHSVGFICFYRQSNEIKQSQTTLNTRPKSPQCQPACHASLLITIITCSVLHCKCLLVLLFTQTLAVCHKITQIQISKVNSLNGKKPICKKMFFHKKLLC